MFLEVAIGIATVQHGAAPDRPLKTRDRQMEWRGRVGKTLGTHPRQVALRNGVFEAGEVVVLSDGAPWIRTTCEEILAGRVAHVIAALKPSPPASATTRPTRTECAATSAASADCRSAPASWKAPASKSSAADSSGPGAAGRSREPTPCSPSNAV